MKLNDFLSKILPTDKFPSNDLTVLFAASGLKEFEVPDSLNAEFNRLYLTRERAENDFDIAKKIRGKHFGLFADLFEKELKAVVAQLPDEFKAKYYAIPETQDDGYIDRIKILKEGVEQINVKGSGDDIKTASEKWRKTEKELREANTALEKLRASEAEAFAKKEAGIKMNYALRSKITGFIPRLDPNLVKLQDQKDFIIDSTINSLETGYLLEFDKENPTAINFLNKDRTGVFEGNTPVTLDQHIEKRLEPYIVKNNNGAPPPATKPTAPTKVQDNGKPMTAHDIRWATAAPAV